MTVSCFALHLVIRLLAVMVPSILASGQEVVPMPKPVKLNEPGSSGVIVEWSIRKDVPVVEPDVASSDLGDGRVRGCISVQGGEYGVVWCGDRVYIVNMSTRAVRGGDFAGLVQVFEGRSGCLDVVCQTGIHIVSIEEFPAARAHSKLPMRSPNRFAASGREGLLLRSESSRELSLLSRDSDYTEGVLFGPQGSRCAGLGSDGVRWYVAMIPPGSNDLSRYDIACLSSEGKMETLDRGVGRPLTLLGDWNAANGRVLAVGLGWRLYTFNGTSWTAEAGGSTFYDGATWLSECEFAAWAGSAIHIWSRSSEGRWGISEECRFKEYVAGVAARGRGLPILVCLGGVEMLSVKRVQKASDGPQSIHPPATK